MLDVISFDFETTLAGYGYAGFVVDVAETKAVATSTPPRHDVER